MSYHLAMVVLCLLPAVSSPGVLPRGAWTFPWQTTLRTLAVDANRGGKDLESFVQKLGGKVKRLQRKDRASYLVDLQGTKITDADLLPLRDMKGVDVLELSFTGVTDKGVANLVGMDELDSLDLAGTKITDAAIKDLLQLPHLHTINLAQTAVTKQGVAKLVQGKDLTICWFGLGKKAQFRVYQDYRQGEVNYQYLMIGDTYFGQYLGEKTTLPANTDPKDRRREATTYYHRHGPVGQVMAKLEGFKPASVLDYPSDVRLPASLVGLSAPSGPFPTSTVVGLWSEPAIGVIRLNTGTHAAYCRPFQHFDFYNSTPEIKVFSLPPKGQPVFFGYLRDAKQRGCQIRVIDGDERITLAKNGPRKYYIALFVDIARNDLRDVNTNLFTKEAIAELMDTLTEKGVLCFHTSHRYHNFNLPLLDAAKSLKLAWKHGKDTGDYLPGRGTHFSSEWLMIARQQEYLQYLTDASMGKQKLTWDVPASTGEHLWRDGQPHDLKALARP